MDGRPARVDQPWGRARGLPRAAAVMWRQQRRGFMLYHATCAAFAHHQYDTTLTRRPAAYDCSVPARWASPGPVSCPGDVGAGRGARVRRAWRRATDARALRLQRAASRVRAARRRGAVRTRVRAVPEDGTAQ